MHPNPLKYLALITPLVLASGCLKGQLATPARDHAVQALLVAESCAADGYGHGKCTQEDLDAMAAQAVCIEAILSSTTCEAE